MSYKVLIPISPATRAKLEAVCELYGFACAEAFAQSILDQRLARVSAEQAEDLLDEVAS